MRAEIRAAGRPHPNPSPRGRGAHLGNSAASAEQARVRLDDFERKQSLLPPGEGGPIGPDEG
jgi:hypothetical protein